MRNASTLLALLSFSMSGWTQDSQDPDWYRADLSIARPQPFQPVAEATIESFGYDTHLVYLQQIELGQGTSARLECRTAMGIDGSAFRQFFDDSRDTAILNGGKVRACICQDGWEFYVEASYCLAYREDERSPSRDTAIVLLGISSVLDNSRSTVTSSSRSD